MRNCIALAVLCLAGTSGQAGELTVLQAASFDVGGYHGVAYYTSESDGFRVVATIAQGETGLPVRFEATSDRSSEDYHHCSGATWRKEPFF